MLTSDNDGRSTPAVSVIVPCYNLGQYLDEAVESVLDQTLSDFEIVVVDDGSTDPETCRLLSGYTRPRTRVIRSKNKGLPAAKNLGVAHSSGAYVCMLDADDRLDSAFLEASVAALDDDQRLTFVSHWLRTFGDEEWDWKPTRCDLEALLDANTVNGAALVRRAALEAVGGFDETMRDGCEDWDLWITLVERGYSGRILEKVLFYYRRRPGSMSRVMMEDDRHPRIFCRLVEKHAASYRRHLPALLARRERDLSQLESQRLAFELDYYRELGPELARRRDDVRMLQARLVDWERDRHLEALASQANERATRAEAEVAALRSSRSWQMTEPIRRLLDLWYRLGGS